LTSTRISAHIHLIAKLQTTPRRRFSCSGGARVIVTFTANPSVDRSAAVDELARGTVMRARGPRRRRRQGRQRLER